MKIRARKERDVEYPSTVICRVDTGDGERKYWTGSKWTNDLNRAKQYLRAEALRRSQKKPRSFIITIGFGN